MVRGLLLLTLAATNVAYGQTYPTRPVRVVVPQPAGGNMDANARALVELVEKIVGVPVTMVGTGPERDDCVVRS